MYRGQPPSGASLPLTTDSAYLQWFAAETLGMSPERPPSVVACAARREGLTAVGPSVRFWVTALDDWAIAALDTEVRSRLQSNAPAEEIDVVVGSPDDDPNIEQWRPFMFYDTTGNPAAYDLEQVISWEKLPRPARTRRARFVGDVAQHPSCIILGILTLAARGWIAARGPRWIGYDIVDDVVRVHACRGLGDWDEKRLQDFVDRCNRFLGALTNGGTRFEGMLHELDLPMNVDALVTFWGYHPTLGSHPPLITMRHVT